MTGLEWMLSSTLLILYIVLIFTVAGLTFRKGYTLLGWLGIIFPVLWLIGAVLPAKRGSRQDIAEADRYRAQMDQMTR